MVQLRMILKQPLLTILAALAITHAQECLDGDLRLLPTGTRQGFVQLCSGEIWRTICRDNNRWTEIASNLACAQLGYSNTGSSADFQCAPENVPNLYIGNIDCRNTNTRIADCRNADETGCTSNSCGNNVRHARVTCSPADCSSGQVRLVDGSSIREGRVEVCQNGRWGTVCNDGWNEQQANQLCSQLGFADQGTMLKTILPHRTVPIYNCTFNSTGQLACQSSNETTCNYTMDLAVECTSYQNIIPRVITDLQQDCNSNISILQDQLRNKCEEKLTESEEIFNTSIQNLTNQYFEENLIIRKQCITNITGEREQCDAQLLLAEQRCDEKAATQQPQISANNDRVTGTLGALTGILAVISIALAIGWGITCYALCGNKQPPTKTMSSVIIRNQATPDQQLDNPVYDASCCELQTYSTEGPTYDTLDLQQFSQANKLSLATSVIEPAGDEENIYHVVSGDEEVYAMPDQAGDYSTLRH